MEDLLILNEVLLGRLLDNFFTKHHMYFLNRKVFWISTKEIYNLLISQKEGNTASRLYYQKKFDDNNLHWKISTYY